MSESFCTLPWLNASIDVDGSIRPCCKFAHQRTDSPYQLGSLKNHKLNELWNSEGMRKLREDFIGGKRPLECSTCWNEEAAGIASYRQTFAEGRIEQIDVDLSQTTVTAPTTLDLKLSNICNLKCRICGPIASSQWMKEELKCGTGADWIRGEQEYLLSNKITADPVNRETFRNWIPQLTHLEIFGGEPLLSRENREIEQMIVDEGYADCISLLYNTNITIFRDEMVERWKKFKHVTLSLSLDDLGERLEYQRSPSRWNEVSENVLKYASIGANNIKVVLFCSVSTYNIWYIPEYLQWAATNCPHLEVHFNIVHNDAEFCITNLPEKIKPAVELRLRRAERCVDGRNPMEVRNRAKITQVIDMLKSQKSNPALWDKFNSVTQEIDRRRSQSFQKAFSEFNLAMTELDF